MATFFLVHGAFHGGWCWYKVAARLAAEGHSVVAPDMPGHGIDDTPLTTLSLELVIDRLADRIDELAGPVVLVGHSMGGAVISALAEARPAKVAKLVYVTAFMMRDGDDPASVLAEQGNMSKHAVLSDDCTTMELLHPQAIAGLYGECSIEDIWLARALLGAEATALAFAPVTVTAERWGAIPRFYIECTRDKALPIELQRQMQRNTGCDQVFTLATDHSPFFSAAVALTRDLMAIAAL